jgi:DNA-binding HxlR family transcriptional regulator
MRMGAAEFADDSGRSMKILGIVASGGVVGGQTGYELDTQSVRLLSRLLNGPALSRQLTEPGCSTHAVAQRLHALEQRDLVDHTPLGIPGHTPVLGRGSYLWGLTPEGRALLFLLIANEHAAQRRADLDPEFMARVAYMDGSEIAEVLGLDA